MFEVYRDKVTSTIKGMSYLPSQSGWKVTGTMDDVIVQKTNMNLPRIQFDKDTTELLLAVLDKDGKRLVTLPCRPTQLYTPNGCTVSTTDNWIVFDHPDGKVWAYQENDRHRVLYKNPNTGHAFILNVLKADPVAKEREKLTNGYVQRPGKFNFIGQDHTFIEATN